VNKDVEETMAGESSQQMRQMRAQMMKIMNRKLKWGIIC